MINEIEVPVVVENPKSLSNQFLTVYIPKDFYLRKKYIEHILSLKADKTYVDSFYQFEKGISEKSAQIDDCVAGLKGFYWSEILNEGEWTFINLSTKNGKYGEEQEFDIREFWLEGDTISIYCNDFHYIDWVKIERFAEINGKYTGVVVSRISFEPKSAENIFYKNAVCNLARPDEGLVDFGQYAAAFGHECEALGYCSTAVGYKNKAVDQYGAIFGINNKGKYASGAFGAENEAMGDASFVAGGASKANGKLAVALGRNLNVEGEYNFAANSANKVYGRANAALNGSEAERPEDKTTDGNTVYGMCNLAIGNNNTATDGAQYSFVGGKDSVVKAKATVALGEGLIASKNNQIVLGRYNAEETNISAVLVVGTGKAGAPKNSLTVYESGIYTPYVKTDELNVTNENKAKIGGKLVATREYVNNTKGNLENKISTVESIAKGANQAVSFTSYKSVIAELNYAAKDEYNAGQNLYIASVGVPDLWVYGKSSPPNAYMYTTDEEFVNLLTQNGIVQVGYYLLAALETQKVDLTDYASKEYVENYVNETILGGEW